MKYATTVTILLPTYVRILFHDLATDNTWEWQNKDSDCRMLPLTDEDVLLLADHQGILGIPLC
jgi:hypothetical protein